jgi:hypothetical protein
LYASFVPIALLHNCRANMRFNRAAMRTLGAGIAADCSQSEQSNGIARQSG